MTDLFSTLSRAADAMAAADRMTGRQVRPDAIEGTNEDYRRLREQVDHLTLVCSAMWQLIRERTNLTEQDLAERVAIIDAKDGVADGKMTKTVKKCPKCNRTMSPKHSRCLYCGESIPPDSIFETV